MFFIRSRKHKFIRGNRNRDPFDYLIKQPHFPRFTSPNVITELVHRPPFKSHGGSADAEFFKAVGRIDNGRPILKVTLCAAENQGRTQFPRYTWFPMYPVFPLPPPPIWRGDARNPSDAVDRFKRPGRAFAPFRVDEDGHSDKRIPRRRNPRFETAISRSIGDRSRLVLEETEGRGEVYPGTAGVGPDGNPSK